jgi:hypothetical protein
VSGVDVDRLRNWALAYERLMIGGLGPEAHTAGVDGFGGDGYEYPYITAADVLALLDRLEAAEADRDKYLAAFSEQFDQREEYAVECKRLWRLEARVEALVDDWESWSPSAWDDPAEDLRAALDGAAGDVGGGVCGRSEKADAWSEGHKAGRDYQGDGWNSDAHDPEADNPYRQATT